MKNYYVHYTQFGEYLAYRFQADDTLHAVQQFENAEPTLKAENILSVSRSASRKTK